MTFFLTMARLKLFFYFYIKENNDSKNDIFPLEIVKC